jgi:hypothetical protein
MKRQFIEQQMLQHAGRMAKNQSTIVKTLTPEEIVEEVIEETKTNEEEIELSSPKKKQKITSTEQ